MSPNAILDGGPIVALSSLETASGSAVRPLLVNERLVLVYFARRLAEAALIYWLVLA